MSLLAQFGQLPGYRVDVQCVSDDQTLRCGVKRVRSCNTTKRSCSATESMLSAPTTINAAMPIFLATQLSPIIYTCTSSRTSQRFQKKSNHENHHLFRSQEFVKSGA